MDAYQTELAARAAAGRTPVTLAELKRQLAALGYALDRRCDARSDNRYITGERAGRSYPATNLYVIEADTRLSAFNVDARRDANFHALQSLRFSDTLFATAHGRILEI